MNKWLGLPAINEYQGLNLYNLSLNSAYVIANTTFENAYIYGVDDYCYECPFYLVKHLKKGEETTWTVDTSQSATWRIMNNDDVEIFPRSHKRGILCEIRPIFNEFGIYRLDIGRCEAKPLIPTHNCYLPLLLLILILLSCGIIYGFIKFVLRCKSCRNNRRDFELNSSIADANEKTGLHVFRGVILTLLIFVTSGGGGYPIFTKSYGGLSAADCLFFAYTWSIGINIPMTINEAVKKGRTKWSIFGDIFVRSFILIFLGMTIDSTAAQFPNELLPIWRPVEMIGGAYLVVGSAYLLSVREIGIKAEGILLKLLSNLITLLWCWVISGFILAVIIILISVLTSYNCIIKTLLGHRDFLYAVPEQSTYCNNDFTALINTIFTSENRKTIFVNGYYGFSGGLLGILSTIMTGMIGLKAGVVYLHHESHSDRAKLWGLWGALFAVGGVMFAVMSIPVRCNLWPISSILLLAALSHIVLISAYTLSEALHNTSYIMNTLGETSLVIICAHFLFSKSLPFSLPIKVNNHSLYLLLNLWTIFLWISISIFLKKSQIKLSI